MVKDLGKFLKAALEADNRLHYYSVIIEVRKDLFDYRVFSTEKEVHDFVKEHRESLDRGDFKLSSVFHAVDIADSFYREKDE